MNQPTAKQFALTEKQAQAWQVIAGDATHVMLLGGSRSGKTFLLVRAVIMRAIKAPESRHAILRFRFNHVKQSVVLDTFPKVMRLCFSGVKYTISKTDWYATLENGSEIWFGGLDDKERAEKILGMEFVTIYLNESSQIPQSSRDIVVTRLAQQVVQKITGRPPVPLKPRMLYDCNPPKKSHWTYKLFVKHVDPSSGKTQTNPEDFVSFKINPKDNECNLSAGYISTLEGLSAALRKRFLLGEFGDDTENGLFDETNIDKWRVVDADELPEMVRIVIAVDPSGSGDVDNADNDSIGIAACGLGVDGIGYVLADLTVKAGPATWGRIVTDAYDRYEANTVVGETNYGGEMVKFVIQTARPRTPYKAVTATRNKQVRAEPVAALYEQGKIRHVGYLTALEDELSNMTTNGYVGTGSPNRADAVVWGFTELFMAIVAEKKQTRRSAPAPNWRAF